MTEKELSKIIAEELEGAKERIYRRVLLEWNCRNMDDSLRWPSEKFEWSFVTLE